MTRSASLSVILLLSASPAAAGLPVVAVFDIENDSRLKRREVRQLTDFVATKIAASGKFRIVPSSELDTALAARKKDSYKACYDQACQIEIGKELAAQQTLATKVARIGTSCVVTMQLYDLRTTASAGAASARGPCSVDAVLGSLEKAVATLSGARPLAPAPKAPDVSGYDNLDDEVAQAKAQAERDRQAREARHVAIETAWAKVERYGKTGSLGTKKRAGVVQKFIADFEGDNPREADARALLAAIEQPEAEVGGEMVVVPGGPFWMGCNEKVDAECEADEKPGRRVHVPAFRIGRTEVTVAEYARCVKAGKCSAEVDTQFWSGKAQGGQYCNWGKAGRSNHPINCLDFADAQAFCAFAGKRLPTEAEWEKAARGTDGRKYAWGNQGFGRERVANIADVNTSYDWSLKSYDDGYAETSPAGSFPAGASPYGALDMIGNVWEWTADWYKANESRVVRGGSWRYEPGFARASNRFGIDPGVRYDFVGVRCVQ